MAHVNVGNLRSVQAAAHPGLEFLDIGPEAWRVLLDEGAVPRSLSAASIKVRG